MCANCQHLELHPHWSLLDTRSSINGNPLLKFLAMPLQPMTALAYPVDCDCLCHLLDTHYCCLCLNRVLNLLTHLRLPTLPHHPPHPLPPTHPLLSPTHPTPSHLPTHLTPPPPTYPPHPLICAIFICMILQSLWKGCSKSRSVSQLRSINSYRTLAT